MKIEISENERIDNLEYKGLKLIQDKSGFCFGLDAILLSDFAKDIKPKAKVLDFGTGTGIISILLCAKTNLDKIYGIELQNKVAKLADKNRILNQLENKFEVICDNITNLGTRFQKGSFDVVVTNPPYKKENTGVENKEKSKIIARHEKSANLEDFI